MMAFCITLFVVIYECHISYTLCKLIREKRTSDAVWESFCLGILIVFGAFILANDFVIDSNSQHSDAQWDLKVLIKMALLIAAAAFYMVLYLNRKMAKIRRKSGTPFGLGVSAILMLLFASFIYVI